MSKEEARRCLVNLVPGVHDALNQLHDSLRLAHLDVRLPNICFTANGDVRLIDFDRSLPCDMPPPEEYAHSFMYTGKSETTVTVEELDWKQLGIMIYCISSNNASEADVIEKDVLSMLTEGFLYSLIFEFTYDDDKFEQWKEELKKEKKYDETL